MSSHPRPAPAATARGGGVALFRVMIVLVMVMIGVVVIVALDVVGEVAVIDRILLGAQRRFLGGVLGLFAQQRLAILLGDLVIIRVDLAERQEAVAIAAVIDERRLQRRLDARHLGEIDVTLELLALGTLEIEFLDPVTLDDRHAGFFPVACVDQHTRGH